MRVESFHSPDQLRQLARKQDDPLLVIRLHGVVPAMENKAAPQGPGPPVTVAARSRNGLGGTTPGESKVCTMPRVEAASRRFWKSK